MAIKSKAARKQRATQSKAQDYLVNGSEYELGKVIGSGSFATVYRAVHVPSRKVCAVKRLDRARKDQERQVESEIEILKLASTHPNIVAFHGWFRDASNVLCLVLGFCEGGSLDSITAQKGAKEEYFAESQVMEWFVQLLSALRHLHDRHIIHRDIKPQNIFCSRGFRFLRLGDLGIAKQLTGTQDLASTQLGTPYYMSPELVANRPYTFASDIWALGCVLYEMAARRGAFASTSLPQLWAKILRNSYQPLPSHFSPPFRQLVALILRADPDDRPTARSLMLLPIVKAACERLASKAPELKVDVSPHVVPPEAAPAAIKEVAPSKAATTGRPRTALKPDPSREDACKAKTMPVDLQRNHEARRVSTPQESCSGGSAAVAASRPPTRSKNTTPAKKPAAAVKPLARTGKGKPWDDALRWIAKQEQAAERRFQASEHEKHMTRVAAKEYSKKNDPVHQAKAAERVAMEKLFKEGSKRGGAAQRGPPRAAVDVKAAGAAKQAAGVAGRAPEDGAFTWGFVPEPPPSVPFSADEIPAGLMLSTHNDFTGFHADSTEASASATDCAQSHLAAHEAPSSLVAADSSSDAMEALCGGATDDGASADSLKRSDADSKAQLNDLCMRLETMLGDSDEAGMQQLLELIWKQTLADYNKRADAPSAADAETRETSLLSSADLRMLRANPSLLYAPSRAGPRSSAGGSSLASSLPLTRAPSHSESKGAAGDLISAALDLPQGAFGAQRRAPPLAVAASLPTLAVTFADAQRHEAAQRAASRAGHAEGGTQIECMPDEEIVAVEALQPINGQAAHPAVKPALPADAGDGWRAAALMPMPSVLRRSTGELVELGSQGQALSLQPAVARASRGSDDALIGALHGGERADAAAHAGAPGLPVSNRASAAAVTSGLLELLSRTALDLDSLEGKSPDDGDMVQVYRAMAQQVSEIQEMGTRLAKKLDRFRAHKADKPELAEDSSCGDLAASAEGSDEAGSSGDGSGSDSADATTSSSSDDDSESDSEEEGSSDEGSEEDDEDQGDDEDSSEGEDGTASDESEECDSAADACVTAGTQVS